MFQWRKDILLDPPERVEECIVTMKGEKMTNKKVGKKNRCVGEEFRRR